MSHRAATAILHYICPVQTMTENFVVFVILLIIKDLRYRGDLCCNKVVVVLRMRSSESSSCHEKTAGRYKIGRIQTRLEQQRGLGGR